MIKTFINFCFEPNLTGVFDFINKTFGTDLGTVLNGIVKMFALAFGSALFIASVLIIVAPVLRFVLRRSPKLRKSLVKAIKSLR